MRFTEADIHLLVLERRGLSVAESILSRADLYQSRIIEPNVAISASRMAETISPVTIALLLMPWVFRLTQGWSQWLAIQSLAGDHQRSPDQQSWFR